MERRRSWLDEIILVNDGPNEDDDLREVMLFFGAERAVAELRAMRFSDGDLCGYSGVGERLVFGVDERGDLAILRREAVAGGETVAARWLRAHVDRVLEDRWENAIIGCGTLLSFEESGQLPETVEGQLAYLRMAENELHISALRIAGGSLFEPIGAEPHWSILLRFALLLVIAFFIGIVAFAVLARIG